MTNDQIAMTKAVAENQLVIGAWSLVITRTLVNLNPIDTTCPLVYSRQALRNATLILPGPSASNEAHPVRSNRRTWATHHPANNLTHESYCPRSEQDLHEVSRREYEAFPVGQPDQALRPFARRLSLRDLRPHPLRKTLFVPAACLAARRRRQRAGASPGDAAREHAK